MTAVPDQNPFLNTGARELPGRLCIRVYPSSNVPSGNIFFENFRAKSIYLHQCCQSASGNALCQSRGRCHAHFGSHDCDDKAQTYDPAFPVCMHVIPWEAAVTTIAATIRWLNARHRLPAAQRSAVSAAWSASYARVGRRAPDCRNLTTQRLSTEPCRPSFLANAVIERPLDTKR